MIYRSLLRPILFRLPPETAHELALHSLKFIVRGPFKKTFASRRRNFGQLKRFGLDFDNPIGLAAGFDKNGVAAEFLAALGFAFIEVGTVTSEPQPGNPKPRVFRLPRDRALINRLGFNNRGAVQLASTIRTHRPDCVLGVNIGKSRSVAIEQAIPDYLSSFEAVYEVADYIAVNVSSPNTPNLRELQEAALLEDLLQSLQKRNNELAQTRSASPRPIFLKIAPDLNRAPIQATFPIALRANVVDITVA